MTEDVGAHPGGEQSIAETKRLAAGPYVSLVTYKKDGTAVATPVWASSDGVRLYVWTTANAGKVKRVRNRGHVRVAPCDARGTLQGEPVDASARVVDSPEDIARITALHRAKYGLTYRLFMVAGLVLRRGPYVGIEITVV